MSVYLDYNATTPLLDCAREAWIACQSHTWGNASSTHMYGQQAQHTFDAAKQRIAVSMSCKAHELVLCGSGTEANALAIHGVLKNAVAKKVLCGAAEHSSILRNAHIHGHVHDLAVDGNAYIDAVALAAAVDVDTDLLCVQFANNEVGSIQDIAALAEIVRNKNPHIHIHVDACQGAGKSPIACDQLDIDSLSFTGHKFGAPKGSGLLYIRAGVKLAALIHGGQQQQDRRSGTEDIAAICAVAAALEWSLAHCAEESLRQRELLENTWQTIHAALPQALWLAHDAARLPGTMSLAYPGVQSSALIPRLDLAGFALSPGSACMAARGDSSHVIRAMGIEKTIATSVVRVSIGAATSAQDMAAFAAAYIAEVHSLEKAL